MYYRWSFTLEFSLDLHVYQGLIQAYYYPYTKLYSFNLVLVSLPLLCLGAHALARYTVVCLCVCVCVCVCVSV